MNLGRLTGTALLAGLALLWNRQAFPTSVKPEHWGLTNARATSVLWQPNRIPLHGRLDTHLPGSSTLILGDSMVLGNNWGYDTVSGVLLLNFATLEHILATHCYERVILWNGSSHFRYLNGYDGIGGSMYLLETMVLADLIHASGADLYIIAPMPIANDWQHRTLSRFTAAHFPAEFVERIPETNVADALAWSACVEAQVNVPMIPISSTFAGTPANHALDAFHLSRTGFLQLRDHIAHTTPL